MFSLRHVCSQTCFRHRGMQILQKNIKIKDGAMVAKIAGVVTII